MNSLRSLGLRGRTGGRDSTYVCSSEILRVGVRRKELNLCQSCMAFWMVFRCGRKTFSTKVRNKAISFRY